MSNAAHNIDPDEIAKFEALASRWWDPKSEFKPLHDLNPLRLDYIDRLACVAGKDILDVGCGGGLLTEAMAERGARVTGIDAGEAPIRVAKLHQLESGVSARYEQCAPEQFAERHARGFDIVTCMEMLEHVPNPASVVNACARMLRPDGMAFFSTLNRNAKSYLLAVVGAEYVLGMLPKGTHQYSKFIRPSELHDWGINSALRLSGMTGITYNPLTRDYSLNPDVSVNYITCFTKQS